MPVLVACGFSGVIRHAFRAHPATVLFPETCCPPSGRVGRRRENGAAGDRWANFGHAAAFFLLRRAPSSRDAGA
jgi:hypothetical protein